MCLIFILVGTLVNIDTSCLINLPVTIHN